MNAREVVRVVCLSMLVFSSGCGIAGPIADEMNPFGQGAGYEAPGQRDNATILNASGGGSNEAERARHELEAMGAYRRALPPQPAYPVIRPAEVRLMWIPDHLNKHGDLVPAHYYYLRVANDVWEVQDAFELDAQLHGTQIINYAAPQTVAPQGAGAPAVAPSSGPTMNYGTGQSGTSTPWVYKESR